MLDQILGAVKKFTEIGIALLALGIVMQVIFGKVVPFVGGDIIAHIVNLVTVLGSEGLVGLIAVGVIWAILKIYRCNTIIKRPIKQNHFYKTWI